ncbi:MAG: putative concanavalin A-like lectin/glucanases superfamily protein [Prokaryotic dsDNA virus sp.]|jgi:hypothetical protein|nr:MAG: putative concanavalin A-like lectin/glucanases superfamily protein [Prokaryotic dsDNA virus sp.]|tara:strand:- start:34771 stop:36063 length:1293 start_codon:yes stop_codon:yes gene_type:complete
MTVKIYRDDAANAIFVEDNNGAQFLNNLQAVTDSPSDTVFRIRDKSRDNLLLSNLEAADVVDENDQVYGADVQSVVNALNTLFSVAGDPSGVAPVITSSLTVNLTEGDTLNYELTATGGVGYEWQNLPSGVTTVEGNVRKLIGGSGLSPATYNITATAINYFGQDSETVALVVSAPPFSNTKSVNFNNQDYLGANAALLDAELGRSGNGSGSGDAWTIHFWFKGGTSNNNSQTIFYFGDFDTANGGHLYLRYLGANDSLRFRYGSNNNNLQWNGANNLLPSGTWTHVMVCYDGGTTGSSSGSINDYYGRFTVYVDGVDVTSGGTWSNSNYGWSSGIDADNLRIGRYSSGTYMRDNCRVDEFAVWGSDQSANVASIYNSGTPFDLSTLGTPPDHWWRMGDGDTYPNIQDNVGTATFVMYNMTAADIVTDAP